MDEPSTPLAIAYAVTVAPLTGPLMPVPPMPPTAPIPVSVAMLPPPPPQPTSASAVTADIARARRPRRSRMVLISISFELKADEAGSTADGRYAGKFPTSTESAVQSAIVDLDQSCG